MATHYTATSVHTSHTHVYLENHGKGEVKPEVHSTWPSTHRDLPSDLNASTARAVLCIPNTPTLRFPASLREVMRSCVVHTRTHTV